MVVTESRKAALIEAIIEQYVRDATPVSSQHIVDALALGVSSATVRNDMAALEQEGYLEKPHASAGRIPTAAAFRFIVADRIERLRHQRPKNVSAKEGFGAAGTASSLAERVGSAAYASFGGQFAFSGIAFLAATPEFRLPEIVEDFGRLLDVATEWETRLRRALDEPIGVFVGDENPILRTMHFSIVAVRLPHRGAFAVVGPVRMDYDRALSALFDFAP